jgi:hypothetical protein
MGADKKWIRLLAWLGMALLQLIGTQVVTILVLLVSIAALAWHHVAMIEEKNDQGFAKTLKRNVFLHW